jgi:hypothetical protein
LDNGKIGLRYNTEKPPFHLLPWDALEELARHYGTGAKKYPARNWESGLIWNEGCAASLERHLARWSLGEDVDPENGAYHDVAMLWNAIALVTFRLRGIGVDDRQKVIPSSRSDKGQSQLQSEWEQVPNSSFLVQLRQPD